MKKLGKGKNQINLFLYLIIIGNFYCCKSKEVKQNYDNSKTMLKIFITDDKWLTESKKVISDFKNIRAFEKRVLELKSALQNTLKLIQGNSEEDIVTIEKSKYYLDKLSDLSIDSLYLNRGEWLELYIQMRYNREKSNHWVVKQGKVISEIEVQILKKNQLLGYILPHKSYEDYKPFLLIDEDTNPLFFVGESVLGLLKYRIEHIEDLSVLNDFLKTNDCYPFIIIIDKDNYLKLKDKILKKNLPFYYKK